MEETKLILKKRTLQGSSNARRLRRSGSLPGIVYSEGKEGLAIELDTHSFELILQHHTSETMLLDATLDGKDIQLLVKDVQHHPVNTTLLHVDFQKVDAKKAIRVNLMIEIVGEAAGAKAGGVLEQSLHEISVECLPKDLIEALEVDVSALEIGDALHVSDIDLGDTFKVITDATSIVVAVAEPRAEEEEADDEVIAEEGAADAEEKSSDEGAK